MVVMRVSFESQQHGISFVQICNESKAAAKEIRAGGPWRAKKEDAAEKGCYHVGKGKL